MENTRENAEAFLKSCNEATFVAVPITPAGIMVAYTDKVLASLVRPELVVPSEDEMRKAYIGMGMNGSFDKIWNACIEEIKRLNAPK